jgi:transposase-like protein
VLYEVLSSTPVAAIQLEGAKSRELVEWLQSCQLAYPVLATLSDGEKAIIEAFRTCWPEAPQQRCQLHFLNNLVEPVLDYDTQLRKQMREDLGGLAQVPENEPSENDSLF